jgi:hypothetical protein
MLWLMNKYWRKIGSCEQKTKNYEAEKEKDTRLAKVYKEIRDNAQQRRKYP